MRINEAVDPEVNTGGSVGVYVNDTLLGKKNLNLTVKIRDFGENDPGDAPHRQHQVIYSIITLILVTRLTLSV
jgi:hypothetical protein